MQPFTGSVVPSGPQALRPGGRVQKLRVHVNSKQLFVSFGKKNEGVFIFGNFVGYRKEYKESWQVYLYKPTPEII